MAITLFDVAIHLGAKPVMTVAGEGTLLPASEFERLGIPFSAVCRTCDTSVRASGAFPSLGGFIRCRECIGDAGFKTAESYVDFVETHGAEEDDE